MSVENGVVISLLNKDYELQSWNEQGEITTIEGMLTIAFSVVSSCSHRDKQLYLTIKIPYMVNMPMSYSTLETEYKKTKEELGQEEERLTKLWDVYKEQEAIMNRLNEETKGLKSENKRLKNKLDFSLLNIDEALKKENLALKEYLGKVDSDWKRERGLYFRVNPVTKKIEKYKNLPTDFSVDKVENFDIDDDFGMCTFLYTVGDHSRHFEIPYSLYRDITGEKTAMIKLDIHEIQKLKDMKRFIINIDEKAKVDKKYFNQFANFLLDNRDEKIKTEEFFKNIKHKSRQSIYNLIHDFERWEFIKDAGHSYWKIDF